MTAQDVPASRMGLLRARTGDGHAKVGFVELFFDLVFVFAVTQLSHLLLHHLTLGGAGQSLLLLLAVWWVWVFTTWATNWLEPEAPLVRLLLFAMMLAGLVMAAAIPKAFETRALSFALAYVVMQVGRTLAMMWAFRRSKETSYRNFQRITAWFAMSGVLWIGGALIGGAPMLVAWTVAMAAELAAPIHGFRVPFLGRSQVADWDIAGGHLAERCGLFIIIALGESILLTGATFADLVWTTLTVHAFLVCVIGSIAMWWIYFNVGAERASRAISTTSNPGHLGRLAYTYIHVIIVAGIIVSAASDEILLKHASDAYKLAYALTIVGGPALFLVGSLVFKTVTAGWPPLSHLGGLALLAMLLAAGDRLSTLTLGTGAAGVLVLVAAWESISLRREIEQARVKTVGHHEPPPSHLAGSS